MIMGGYRTGTAAMKKYQQLAQQLTEQIALGVWLPGDRLPSLREQVISSGMSCLSAAGKPGAHRRPSAVGLLCRPSAGEA